MDKQFESKLKEIKYRASDIDLNANDISKQEHEEAMAVLKELLKDSTDESVKLMLLKSFIRWTAIVLSWSIVIYLVMN